MDVFCPWRQSVCLFAGFISVHDRLNLPCHGLYQVLVIPNQSFVMARYTEYIFKKEEKKEPTPPVCILGARHHPLQPVHMAGRHILFALAANHQSRSSTRTCPCPCPWPHPGPSALGLYFCTYYIHDVLGGGMLIVRTRQLWPPPSCWVYELWVRSFNAAFD